MRDLANSLHVVRAISPAAATADNTPIVSQVINLVGFDSAVFAINLGALADADATFAVTVDAATLPDMSDAAAVPASKLTGTLASASFTFADDNKVRKIGYVGNRQYVRLTITPANNAGNAFVSAIAILGNSRYGATPTQS